MKILLLGDLHFDIKNSSQIFLNYQKKLIDYVFQTMTERNIDTFIQFGDLTDRRKYMNFNTGHYIKKYFVNPIIDNNFKCYIIAGNHDCYFKNTNEVNSLNILLDGQQNIRIFDNLPEEIRIDKTSILMTPWICSENKTETLEIIRNSKSDLCFGHLELTGYEMESGDLCSYGLDPNIFKHFKKVYSGHFHQISSKGNVQYLGAPFPLTWADYTKDRGFWILDTNTHELEFIKNPFNIFEKLIYDDKQFDSNFVIEHDFYQYKDKIIKLYIRNKDNLVLFEQFVQGVESSGVHDLSIIDDMMNFNDSNNEIIIQDVDDTKEIIKKYVDELQLTDSIKSKVNNILVSLHNDAISDSGI